MGDSLDEISRVLGRIEAHQSTTKESTQAIFRRVDELRMSHHETMGALKEQNARLTFMEEELAQTVIPAIEDINKLKQRGIGVLAFIGLLGAGAGAMLMKFTKLLSTLGG